MEVFFWNWSKADLYHPLIISICFHVKDPGKMKGRKWTCCSIGSNCKYRSWFELYHLRLMSSVTALVIGDTKLLFNAWQVKTVCRCFLSNFSKWRTLRTLRSDRYSKLSSKSAFSCHHVTFGGGRPMEKKTTFLLSKQSGCDIYYKCIFHKYE